MFRARTLHKLLLLASLAMGQWLVVAHAAQHPALGGADNSCQICLHGQNLQSGLTAAPIVIAIDLTCEQPQSTIRNPAATPRHVHHPIRAPPTLLV